MRIYLCFGREYLSWRFLFEPRLVNKPVNEKRLGLVGESKQKRFIRSRGCLVVLQRRKKQGNDPAKAGSPENTSRREIEK